ncbi:MAG: hypothetical protein AAGJ46_12760 [Planctomycetota bacterium]
MIVLDRVGFPLIQVEPLGGYLSFLPITKYQFEYYICDPSAGRNFGEQWYASATRTNRRRPAAALTIEDYWNAFMTSVTPAECRQFAEWYADDESQLCDLPTDNEWRAAYEHLASKPTIDPAAITGLPDVNPRARQLVTRLTTLRSQQPLTAASSLAPPTAATKEADSLADQMLMRRGVFEWVRLADGWGGRGQPPASIGGGGIAPHNGSPRQPTSDENQPYYGFRLLIRE